jgi:serine/threonine-protein kinase RsbW
MSGPTNKAELSVACGPLAGPVLGRVIAMLAARANLPIDRLNDAVLLGDTIAANSRGAVLDGRVRITIHADGPSLELRVGPLVEDGAERIRAAATLPGTGDIIARLADEVSVESDEQGEYLLLAVG